MIFDREDLLFNVVLNDEEQYSIWPDFKELPLGWRKAGFAGMKKECLDYIDRTWLDMRPKSLREEMARRDGDDAL